MVCVFLRWFFFGNSPEIGRDRKGRQKKSSFFLGFLVISWLGSRCFCYCFALILFAPLSFLSPGKLVFFADLVFLGGGFSGPNFGGLWLGRRGGW